MSAPQLYRDKNDKLQLVRIPLEKRRQGKCQAKGCRKRKGQPRPEKRDTYCSRCGKALWRARNPYKYRFGTLRMHALTAGQEFSITFKYFEALRAGRDISEMDFDRKDPLKGYVPGNVQFLHFSVNRGCKAENDKKLHNSSCQEEEDSRPF